MNYTRRTIGAAICLAPVAVLLVSFGVGLVHPRENGFGFGISVAGLLLGLFNLYLTFIRPSLYLWRHGSIEGLKNVSGIPLFGTLLVVAGGVIGFCDWRSATVGLVTLTLDVGGLPWFLFATWHDRSLWDA